MATGQGMPTAWLGWVGAAVVAALVTAAAVWTGWRLRRLLEQWRPPRPRRRPARRTTTAAPAAAAPDPVTAAAGRTAYAAGVPVGGTTSPAPAPAPSAGAPQAAAGEAAAVLEELLDRLHAAAETLDSLAREGRTGTGAPATAGTAGPAWDLEFLNRRG